MVHAAPRACVGLLAGMLAVSSPGCTRSADDRGSPDFFPLHSEDTWVYDVVRPLHNERTRMTVRVRGDRYIQPLGRRCQLVDETYAAGTTALGLSSGAAAQPELYPVAYCHKDGYLFRALSLEYDGREIRDIGLGSSEERFLPDGLRSDLSWDSVTTAYNLGGGTTYGVHQTHRTVLEAVPINVPAGWFNGCVRVETVALHQGQHEGKYDGDPIVWYYTDWYAPNVGLIRTTQSTRPDGGPPTAQIELVSYDVEGAQR